VNSLKVIHILTDRTREVFLFEGFTVPVDININQGKDNNIITYDGSKGYCGGVVLTPVWCWITCQYSFQRKC